MPPLMAEGWRFRIVSEVWRSGGHTHVCNFGNHLDLVVSSSVPTGSGSLVQLKSSYSRHRHLSIHNFLDPNFVLEMSSNETQISDHFNPLMSLWPSG